MRGTLIFLLCIVAVSALAQGPGRMGGPGMRGPGGGRPSFSTREWGFLKPLHLNHSQDAKAHKIVDKFDGKAKAMFASMRPPQGAGGPGVPGGRPGGPGGPGGRGGGFGAMREKMQALRKEYEGELSKVLTKEQMAEYAKARDADMARRRAMFGGGRGGGRPGGAPGRG